MPERNRTSQTQPEVSLLLVTADAEADHDLVFSLEEAGFHVTAVKAFDDVRQALRETGPDVVLLHTERALGPQLTLYSSLRAGLKDAFVPFVVLAEEGTAEEEVTALSAGVDAFLSAPIHPVLLVARLQSLLRIKALHDELRSANERLGELSRIDPGTGLHNRRYFFDRLEEEFARVERREGPLSLIMMDIDNFKQANDLHGHLFGDHLLKQLAGIIEDVSRRIDIVARYGGEEFAFILPGTSLEAAASLAERVRRTVAATVFKRDKAEMSVTVSLGVAERFHCDAEDPDGLVQSADKALYEAKARGRNRLAVHGWPEDLPPIPDKEPPPIQSA